MSSLPVLLLASFSFAAAPRAASPAPGPSVPAGAPATPGTPASPAPQLLKLPAPKLDGKVSVEKVLKERRSVRQFAARPLELGELSQLCWAAQGITDAKGHRTAPSARATYPLELYVVASEVKGVASALYRYRPEEHALLRVEDADLRNALVEKAVEQPWILKAPAIFVVTGVEARFQNRTRAADWLFVEAGLVAENLFLQATSLGLGGTFVGGFDPAAAAGVLGLPQGERVLALLPMGPKG